MKAALLFVDQFLLIGPQGLSIPPPLYARRRHIREPLAPRFLTILEFSGSSHMKDIAAAWCLRDGY